MKKKITRIICDICQNEDVDDDDICQCDICHKDVCSDCRTTFDFCDNQYFKEIVICEDCSNEDEIEKEMKKFFKQPLIKQQLSSMRDEAIKHLIKIAMVNSLKSKSKDL